MAKKRPSYVSIRTRQVNVIEGLGSGKLKYKRGAELLGVTPRQLKKFVETKPKDLRKNYNRSPAIRKLYGTGTAAEQRKRVKGELGIKRVRRYTAKPKELKDLKDLQLPAGDLYRRQAIGEIKRNLYTSQDNADSLAWAIYTYEHDLPPSIDAIKLLHRNGRITDDDYDKAIEVWRSVYKVKDAVYSKYAA